MLLEFKSVVSVGGPIVPKRDFWGPKMLLLDLGVDCRAVSCLSTLRYVPKICRYMSVKKSPISKMARPLPPSHFMTPKREPREV